MATRLLNNAMRWKGEVTYSDQSLPWPRIGFELDGLLYDPSPLPRGLVEATCELARIILRDGDITKPGDEEDLKSLQIGPLKFEFNRDGYRTSAEKADNILPASVLMILDGFGRVETVSGGAIRLIRG